MTSEVVLGWRFQLSVRSGVKSSVVLRTMPTSQNRDMGHPLLCLVGGLGATVRGDCSGWTPGLVALRAKCGGSSTSTSSGSEWQLRHLLELRKLFAPPFA